MTVKRTVSLSLLFILLLNLLVIGSEMLLSGRLGKVSDSKTNLSILKRAFDNKILEHRLWQDSVMEHILDGWPFEKGLDHKENPAVLWLGKNISGFTDEQDQEILRESIAAIEAQYAVAGRIVAETDLEVKQAIYLNDMVPAIQALSPLVGQLTTNYNIHLDEMQKEIDRFERWGFFFKVATATLSILSLLFIGLVLGRLVISPLGSISEGIGTVGSGDLRVALQYGKSNEIGKIADNFNAMMESLRGIISNINSSTVAMNGVMEKIKSSAESSSESSRAQSAKAAQIAVTSEEMNQTILDIARNASVVSNSSSEALSVTQKGREVVRRAQDLDKEVYDSTIDLSTMMDKLSKKASDIEKIVEVINDIADQTNLLALNAAIEAARAGEQGRGFGVVADEVRKLAERTLKATSEISSSIADVLVEIKATNQGMGVVTTKVIEVTSGIKEVDVSFEGILSAIMDVSEKISHIAVAVEQQSSATEEVTREIEDSSRLSKEIEEQSKAVLGMINSMDAVAKELNGSIAHFKV